MSKDKGPALVLMAVDNSTHSEYAFNWYVQHFHRSGNRLLLVHCPETFANVTMMSPSKVQELITQCEEKMQSLEKKYTDKMNEQGIKGDFARLDGEKPGPSIVECAASRNVTFIVTGTRGLGKFRRALMGSVSDYVIHHSPVPVLVCRHKDKD
ncbi:universal stress protein in QAH/OAS sulfhydrylase 3'region-like isoform X1 [Haliotis rufescens]|uniref:universal stress protein in QAH/OAS sulfhydrylase 3'region-like isoform X1 n=1 Tax=Haliotis rufescens TaxID=6454 RepID=UPI001EAFAF04|nr:universal stress protein in QAH/OAS sulfhydrylase 3'region-like isoform X1 [Haliotis rufescens]